MMQMKCSGEEILEWFDSRVCDHLPNEHYQSLFSELARLITGDGDITTPDDVSDLLARGKKEYPTFSFSNPRLLRHLADYKLANDGQSTLLCFV